MSENELKKDIDGINERLDKLTDKVDELFRTVVQFELDRLKRELYSTHGPVIPLNWPIRSNGEEVACKCRTEDSYGL